MLKLNTECSFAAVRELRADLRRVLLGTSLDEEMRNHLLLAVSEIASNAVRHADPPASRLKLELNREAASWVLEVADNGGPFHGYSQHQDDMASTALQDGLTETGMGLALISQLFPDHQYLPASDDGFNVYRLCIDDGQPAIPRVALIDDDPAMLAVLAAYLQECYQVQMFDNAANAAVAIAAQPVDLVISDINMPGMSGMELRARLARDTHTDVLPFVFLTASGAAESIEAAASLGVDDYLIKPVRKQDLLASARRVLVRSQRVRQRLGERFDEDITKILQPGLSEQLGGYKAVVRARTAGSGGGDFLYHHERNGMHTLVLGDVMGHGNQAKFYAHAHMGYLHGVLASLDAPDTAAAILCALSAAIAGNAVLESTLVTCLAVRLETNGVIRVASAGHPAPLWCHSGQGEVLEVSGPLPGLIEDADYAEIRVQLEQGQRLVMYTDGLFESVAGAARQAGLEQRIVKVMNDNHDFTINEFADCIMAEFDTLAGSAPRDDATLVILEKQ